MDEKKIPDLPPTQQSTLTRPLILGDLTLASPTTQATVGSAGTAASLPAKPTGFLKVVIGNTPYVIPYYAAS